MQIRGLSLTQTDRARGRGVGGVICPLTSEAFPGFAWDLGRTGWWCPTPSCPLS